MSTRLLLLALSAGGANIGSHAATPDNKNNVLYIVVDDLRADFGTYGLPVQTPHIDALAASAGALRFNRSYCQLSVCAPSRMSFMTSRRPDTFGVWNFIDTVPEVREAMRGGVRGLASSNLAF